MKRLKPKISIIIPVYNGSNYMKQAIDSALNQTYKNTEIIVINDGSNDKGKTEKIALSYGNKIRYFQKENGGVASAFNFGISKMTGDYFSWLSHDDVYFEDKLENQVKYLINNKIMDKKVFLYTDFNVIDENCKFMYQVVHDHEFLTKKPEYALLKGAVNGNTILVSKKAFEEHGLFNTNLRVTQDYDMWFRIMQSYDFIHIPVKTCSYRNHGKNDTNNNPRVITEGNPLWIKLINEMPYEFIKKIEKDELFFYKTALECVKNATLYKEAEQFAILKIENYERNKKYLTNYNDKQPAFSIIMAVYNTERYLEEAILSVINQTLPFRDYVELILINDGSSDDSEVICKRYQELYPNNIKYIKKKNGGVSSARNEGIKHAIGKYYNFLDSDDKLSLNALEEILYFFINCGKEVDIVALRPTLFGAVNQPIGNKEMYNKTRVIDLRKDIFYFLQSVAISFIKADCFDKLRFNTNLAIGEDGMIVNTILLAKYKFGVVSNAYYYIRKRETKDSATDLSLKKRTLYINTVQEYFIEIFKNCLKQNNSIPLHLQAVMIDLIYWITSSPSEIKKILDDKEQQDFMNNIKWLISNINIDLLNKKDNISKEFIETCNNIRITDNPKLSIIKINKAQKTASKLKDFPLIYLPVRFLYRIFKSFLN